MTAQRWMIVLMTWLAMMLAVPAQAQAPAAGPHITLTTAIEHSAVPAGGRTTLAIAMTPAPGWHGYWKNGGDAGFGMQLRWRLPAGVSVGELDYPVPQTLVIAGLMNHVYEQPYALLAPVNIAPNIAPGTALTIEGEAQWLACTDQVCVPERGTVRQTLIVGSGGTRDARFDGWRAALPPMLSEPATVARAGETLRIAIPLPAAVNPAAPHLFIEQPRINQPGAAQRFLRSGDRLIAETPAGDEAATAEWNGLLRLDAGRGLRFVARPGLVPESGTAIATTPAAGAAPGQGTASGATDMAPGVDAASGVFDGALFLTALFGAIIGGLILNIMPCVFPILSLKALALARAGGDGSEARQEGIAYTTGAVLTCAALGTVLLLLRAGGEALGWAFQLQRPESVVLLIVLMGAITANLAGLFDFGSLSVANRIGARGGKSAFATGALAAFVATPCTGPFLGAALGATLALPAWAALPIFAGLGLGLALPFLAIALIPPLRARLPKPGPWMETLKRWLALPMGLTVLALVWLLGRQAGSSGWVIGGALLIAIAALAAWAGSLQRRGAAASLPILLMAALIVPAAALLPKAIAGRSATGIERGQAWSAAALAEARARGAVLVDFTADWCVTCKVTEAAAINRDEVQAAFAQHRVTLLIADWTNADPAITAELARHGRNSVPLYLWYPAGGGEPEILPQLLTPAMLIERARAR